MCCLTVDNGNSVAILSADLPSEQENCILTSYASHIKALKATLCVAEMVFFFSYLLSVTGRNSKVTLGFGFLVWFFFFFRLGCSLLQLSILWCSEISCSWQGFCEASSYKYLFCSCRGCKKNNFTAKSETCILLCLFAKEIGDEMLI